MTIKCYMAHGNLRCRCELIIFKIFPNIVMFDLTQDILVYRPYPSS